MPSNDCGDARSAAGFGMSTQIRSVLTVVGEGSPHRAAARLRISQSALSRQMQALEHELGGRLLERMTTGVSPSGVVVLPLADAEVTWKILVMWRRGRAGGALKALLDALFTKVTPKANETTRLA